MADDPNYELPTDVNDGTSSSTEDTTGSPGEAGEANAAEARVPYSRFSEVVRARQQADSRAAQFEAEAQLARRQIEALTGVQPPARAVDPRERQIRDDLERMYPALKQLDGLPFDKLKGVIERAPEYEAAVTGQHRALADQTLGAIYSAAKEMYGKDVSDDQKRFFHASFVQWLEFSPERQRRYVGRDGGLVPEFVKSFASTMLDPIRRQAAVTVDGRVSRAGLAPQGGSGTGVAGTKPPAFKPGDEDARHDAAWVSFRAQRG